MGEGSPGGSFQRRTAIALEELTPAKRVKMACFNPFLDDGLVHFGCRLQCGDLTRQQQHPLILEGAHRFTELLIPTNPHPITSLWRAYHIVAASK